MSKTKRLTLSGMFLALGFILPLFTGQVPQIGSMLLPMHIPVFLCAFICGWQYATPMAFALPLLRSSLFNRPQFYPDALSICFEMAVYALVAGLLYARCKKVYPSLIAAMILGKGVRILIQVVILGFPILNFGIPGIIIQLILIPLVMMIYEKRPS